jgi:hypothetical protein
MRILILLAALAATTAACGDKPSSNLPPKSPEFNVKKASNGSGPVSLDEMMKASGMPPLDESPGLMGPDTNGNGVRDDIEAWINSLPHTAEQKKALMQFTAALQQNLLHSGNAEEARVSDAVTSTAQSCLYKRFDRTLVDGLTGRIESYVANTMERALAYARFSDALHGSTLSLPKGDEVCEHRAQSALAVPASSNAKAVF